MKVTLVYADCCESKFGDFSFAGEFAYLMQVKYFKYTIDHVLVLTSSQSGVSVFRKMYGTSYNPERLTIHGENFESVVLSDFVRTNRKNSVINYIEVGSCVTAPSELVNKIVTPLATRALFVGLPLEPIMGVEKKHLAYMEFHPSFRSTISLGIGKDRFGLPVYSGTLSEINHLDYFNITKRPFGFAYVNGNQEDNAVKFTLDYIKLVRRSKIGCDAFFIVGDCEISLKAIKSYAILASKKIHVYDLSHRKVSSMVFNNNKSLLEVKTSGINPNTVIDEKAINIVITESVPHEQMRALAKGSIHFTGATGISSTVEALSFGKIVLYQFMEINRIFIEDYQKAFQDNCSEKMKENFLELLIWFKKYSTQELDTIVSFINNEQLYKEFQELNYKLLADNKMVTKVCQLLHLDPLPAPVSQDSTQQLLTAPAGIADGASGDNLTTVSNTQQGSELVPYLGQTLFGKSSAPTDSPSNVLATPDIKRLF